MAKKRILRRRKRRQKLRQIGAWIVLILLELVTAAVPTILAAVILIPLAKAERGYEAFGGEWLMITGTFCIAYSMIHKKVCKKIFKEG